MGSGPRVEWHFNAAHAPWWGGFFERMMRMIMTKLATLFMTNKHRQFPTMDSFREAVSWTQLVLSSRPVSWAPTCGQYGQPVLAQDLFLPRLPDIDNPFEVSIPDVWLEAATQNELADAIERRTRWQDQVWTSFTDTYVSELRKRRQEKEVPGRCPLLEVGQVVLYKPPVIGKEATPMKRLTWRMARIAKMHPGRDS